MTGLPLQPPRCAVAAASRGRLAVHPHSDSPGASPLNPRRWVPLCVLSGIALAFRNGVPAWVFMWMMALALFFGFKWVTARRAGLKPGLLLWGYFFAWPGMDAEKFFRGSRNLHRSGSPSERSSKFLLWAALKVVAGLLILWLAATDRVELVPLLKGWLAMVGLVLALHLGLFDMLAFCWQRAGVDVEPVMHSPILSRSLSEFWGARWNTAFHKLAHTLAFRPLAGQLGVAAATLIVFLISGLVHECVISVPARGGYGLPTAYFLLQGCGVLAERSLVGRWLGLNHGARGRLFALSIAALPAFWLFHPPFVTNVILPMLAAVSHFLKTI